MTSLRDRDTQSPVRRFPFWPLTLLIGGMCLLELAIRVIGVAGPGAERARFAVLEYTAFWPGLLGDWQPHYAGQQWLMFLSYGFFHGGLLHLVVNMVTLLSVGGLVLERFGVRGFWLVYGGSLVGGAVGYGVLAATPVPMVGASGALFGLVGALLAREFVSRFAEAMSLWPVFRAIGFLALLNVVLWWAMGGRLAWQAHLGGFVIGWAVAVWVMRRAPTR